MSNLYSHVTHTKNDVSLNKLSTYITCIVKNLLFIREVRRSTASVENMVRNSICAVIFGGVVDAAFF